MCVVTDHTENEGLSCFRPEGYEGKKTGLADWIDRGDTVAEKLRVAEFLERINAVR